MSTQKAILVDFLNLLNMCRKSYRHSLVFFCVGPRIFPYLLIDDVVIMDAKQIFTVLLKHMYMSITIRYVQTEGGSSQPFSSVEDT